MFIVQILQQKVELSKQLNMHVIIIVNKVTSTLLYMLTPHT